jgi:hypothetical protein
MVAHGLVNFPVRGVADFVLPALMLVVIMVCRKPILEETRSFWEMLKTNVASWWITAIGMTGMIVFMAAFAVAQDAVALLGVPLLVIALVMELIEKRKLHRVGTMQEGQPKAA